LNDWVAVRSRGTARATSALSDHDLILQSTDSRLPSRCGANVGRGGAVGAAEGAIEIGEAAEAAIEDKRRHAPIEKARIGEHPVHPRKSLSENVFGEGGAFGFEQHLQVARRHAEAPGHVADDQALFVQPPADVAFGGVQPRRSEATAAGYLGGITRRADRKRDQIADVAREQLTDLRRRQSMPAEAIST